MLDQGKLANCNLKEYLDEIKSIINITTAIVKTTQKSLNQE
ncbi:MAG: hypothetical protein IMY74_07395 [Bacteroidetes bacterium]|nr:hypothetical protein [Bacteroidota bacterium]MCK5766141.1 hypothetical protein [Bacteroidales bacterium]